MRWIIIFYCLLSLVNFNIAQTSLTNIQQFSIKFKLTDEKIQRGYLMDIDRTTLTYFTNKKYLKQNLLNGCQSCQKVPLANLEKLTILGNKQHSGKIIGGMIALLITGIAASNPRGDGLDAGATAGIYGGTFGTLAIGLGAGIDGLVNNSQQKAIDNRHKSHLIKNNQVDGSVLAHFMEASPYAQFEILQREQQLVLKQILKEIQTNPLMHQQRFSFFSKNIPVQHGYLVGSDEIHLFLSDDLFSLVEDRAQLPKDLKKVAFAKIFYYQTD